MELKLPLSVISQTDINRLLREIDGLDDFFIGAARQSDNEVKPPRITYRLEQVARDNKYNLLGESQRADLKAKLKQVLKDAPLLHISFAAEPAPRIIDTILSWLRTNIHPQTLLGVGLQPSIAAGCVLRTPNRIFDMSLRIYLEKQEDYLAELIKGAAARGKR